MLVRTRHARTKVSGVGSNKQPSAARLVSGSRLVGTALPQQADNQVAMAVRLVGETWAAEVPERGQATWVRTVEVAETKWGIAVSLAVAVDLERLAAEAAASAGVAHGPAVPVAPQAWAVVVAGEVGVVDAADDRG
jgi:hypothetical protein